MTTLVKVATIEPSLYNGLATLTGSQTLTNKLFKVAKENVTIVESAPPSALNFDLVTHPILMYNVNTSTNFTVDIRGVSTLPYTSLATPSTTLNSLLNVGESITANLFVKCGAVPHYPTQFAIDGVVVTPKYQNGTPFAGGDAFSIDLYVMVVIKTGNSAWNLFVSQTQFG
jgi:hypothetical protein